MEGDGNGVPKVEGSGVGVGTGDSDGNNADNSGDTGAEVGENDGTKYLVGQSFRRVMEEECVGLDNGADTNGSIGCRRGSQEVLVYMLAKSAIVSVATQKWGGLSFHPIRSVMGKATNFRLPGATGKENPSISTSLGLRPM